MLRSLAVLAIAAAASAHSLRASFDGLARLTHLVAQRNVGNSTLDCIECEAVIGVLADVLQSKDVEAFVMNIARDVCISGHGGDGYSCGNPWACNDLCTGITSLFTPEVLYIASQLALDPQTDCQFLGLCPKPSVQEAPASFVAVAPPAAAVAATPRAAGSTFKVVHISDTHWDPMYSPGARTDCGEPDCCREVQGLAENSSTTCGYWGDHNGDTPPWLVDLMLETAAALDPQFVMVTGDDPPHMVWNITAQDVMEISMNLSAKIKNAFPNTPVFSCYGNHEGGPIDQFRLELNGVGTERLYGPTADQWQEFGWLDSEALATLRAGGYYTTLVPGVSPPLRIVALHPSYHIDSNFYTVLNKSLNIANMTEWMDATVRQAAANNETVWVLSHHPTNDGGYDKAWLEGFLAPLVAEFRSTIRHTFSGHTHKAQVQLLWANASSTGLFPAHVEYIVPAPTPYGGVNPSFRIYEVDSQTYTVVDYTDYTVDLEAQGLVNRMTVEPKPVFKPSYSAKAAYSMRDLSPSSWHSLAEQMRTDDALFHQWELNFHTNNSANADYSEQERLIRVCDILGGTKTLNKACMDGKFNTTLSA
jgi:sphingomyelin phosphodiesterase